MHFLSYLLPGNPMGLEALDWALAIFHTALILFVMLGACFCKLVPYHFPVIVLVWMSWIGLGLYMGNLGYCILTDWHWQVKLKLGANNLPASYITYLYHYMFGVLPDPAFMHNATGGVMMLVTAFSLYRFIRWKRGRN